MLCKQGIACWRSDSIVFEAVENWLASEPFFSQMSFTEVKDERIDCDSWRK